MNVLMLLAFDFVLDNVMKILIHQVVFWATTNVHYAGKKSSKSYE